MQPLMHLNAVFMLPLAFKQSPSFLRVPKSPQQRRTVAVTTARSYCKHPSMLVRN